MGPLLLSRLLELNDVQAGVLTAAFKLADDQGLLLLDLKDLRALLAFIAENAGSLTGTYGNISKASVGAIQRQLLVLESQDAEKFFGEPALQLSARRDAMSLWTGPRANGPAFAAAPKGLVHLEAVERLKDLTRARFSLGPEDAVMVSESAWAMSVLG